MSPMRRCASFSGALIVVGLLVASPAFAQNLVTNGSFEDPVVTRVGFFTQIPGWVATRGCGIEIQNNCFAFGCGPSAQGDQHVELDSADFQGSGCQTSSAMTAQ